MENFALKLSDVDGWRVGGAQVLQRRGTGVRGLGSGPVSATHQVVMLRQLPTLLCLSVLICNLKRHYCLPLRVVMKLRYH